MYFFGCDNHRKGHYIFRNAENGYIDPLSNPENRRMSWATICDAGLLNMDREQVEGEATYSYLKGYSIISFWDRSVDGRTNSCASFLVFGRVTFKNVLLAARTHFPKVFARFNFEIVEVDWD